MPPRAILALSHFLPAFTMQTQRARRPTTPRPHTYGEKTPKQAGGLTQGRVSGCEQTEMPPCSLSRQLGLRTGSRNE